MHLIEVGSNLLWILAPSVVFIGAIVSAFVAEVLTDLLEKVLKFN